MDKIVLNKKFIKYILPVISVGVVVALFYAISAIICDPMVVPSPTAVFTEFFLLLKKGIFYKELLFNLLRTVASFLFALVIAVVFSVLAGVSEIFARIFYPITVSVRAVPTMSVFLWCLIIFRSNVSPMAVAFIVDFPILYSAIYGAIISRDKKIDRMAEVFSVSKPKFIFKVVLPDVFGRLFNELLSVFSFTVKLIVAGEVLAYTKTSIGREMQLANVNLETAKLFALTVAVILLSVISEGFVKLLYYCFKKVSYGYKSRKIIEKLR